MVCFVLIFFETLHISNFFILQTTSWWHHSIKDGWSLLHTGLTRGQQWGHIRRLSATSLLPAGKESVFSIFQGLSWSLWGLFLYFLMLIERNPVIFGGPSDGSVCLGVAILICLRPLLIIHISFVTITVQCLMLENWNVLDCMILYWYTPILQVRMLTLRVFSQFSFRLPSQEDEVGFV